MNRSLVRAAASALAAVATITILLAVPVSTPSQAATFTLSDPNCSSFTWDSASSTLTCVTGGGGGAGAVSCTFSASPSLSTTVGTNVTLSVPTCSGGTSYGYAWTGSTAGCPAIGTAASQETLTSPVAALGPCVYSVTVSDSGGATSWSSGNKSLTWSAAGGGGGGGGGNISCNGFSATHVISASWANSLYYTSNSGGFGPNDAIVVKFTTSSITTSTKTGYIQAVEYSDPTTARYGALSDTPCDFSVGLPLGGGGQSVFYGDVGPWSYLSLFNKKTGAATLQPNTTYYFNIANMPGACGGSCNMQITLTKPGGT